jgi:asparagine synthase (glutamine-hydrolysing)
MCGIAGILDPDQIDPVDLRRMADSLAHRGPDDVGFYQDEGIGFAFRRLSIIDLATGAQPMSNEDGSVWVMLNGEIYNYAELRERLSAGGHRFRTRSDTEVLAHLYEDKETALVDDLRGMFAFAIWDRSRRRLVLARDHLGQKPLFWARRGRRLYFASEIKAILAVEPRFRKMDPIALHEYLSIRVISSPRSMFESIRKLPPAHVLEVQDGEIDTRRYWSLRYEPKRRLSEDDAIDELHARLRETIEYHLVSDVPVGCFLSGGVDSTLITSLVSSITGQTFKTFSIRVPYGPYDEGPAAQLVAARYGTQHFERSVQADLLAALPELVRCLDEPSDPLSATLYPLAEMTAREVKVVLGGDGGDELFGGYDRYWAIPQVRYFAMLPRAIRSHALGALVRHLPDGFWYKSLSNRLRWLSEVADVEGGYRYARSLSYFYFTPDRRHQLYTPRFERETASFDAEQAIAAWCEDGSVRAWIDRMMLADLMVRLPNHSVMILDRMTMAHGLEARSPFLDHRLAEFTATLPAGLKTRGRNRRYLEMKLAERYVPQEVLQRPKQGLASPLPYIMDAAFAAMFKRYLRDSRLVDAGYLRSEAIEDILQEHLDRRVDHGNRLWLLLNAEIWHRIKIEGQSAEAMGAEMRELLSGPAGEPDFKLAASGSRVLDPMDVYESIDKATPDSIDS